MWTMKGMRGYEWIAGFVIEEGNGRKLYEVWIRNGERIAYELYVE